MKLNVTFTCKKNYLMFYRHFKGLKKTIVEIDWNVLLARSHSDIPARVVSFFHVLQENEKSVSLSILWYANKKLKLYEVKVQD